MLVHLQDKILVMSHNVIVLIFVRFILYELSLIAPVAKVIFYWSAS